MLATLREWRDELLGRGRAAITVPVMDGALKPNRALDEASVVAELPGLDDIASNGDQLYASAGAALWRLEGETLSEWRRFDGTVTAVALSGEGKVAVALEGRRVVVLHEDGAEIARLDASEANSDVPPGRHSTLAAHADVPPDRPSTLTAHLDAPPGRHSRESGNPATFRRAHRQCIPASAVMTAGGAMSVNALAFDGEDALVVSDGSQRFAPAQWCHDLMTQGRSGSVARWRFATSQADMIAQNQRYAFGVLAQDGGVLHSESWHHRVMRTDTGGTRSLIADLPAYPSRMAPASGGGFWLTCFACRTQLVEFVLREDAYRERMIAQIDPRYWVAPALSSGQSFLEPLQGAGVKQMGVLKPWAPPRSYGLVLRVAADGRIERSLHSLVDGKHHGITAAAEYGGALHVASKGSGRLLKVALS